MHIRGRKRPSSAGESKEQRALTLQEKSSTPFRRAFQRITTAAPRRKPQPALITKDEENSSDSASYTSRQATLSDAAQQEIHRQDALLQGPGPAPWETRTPTPHGCIVDERTPQPEQSTMTLTSDIKDEGQAQSIMSCEEMVALKLSYYRPKAQEIQLTCSVCMDSLPLQSFPAYPITSTCLLDFHRAADESFICKSCINDSIQAQLDTSRPDTVHCPLCNERMAYDDIKRWTEHEIFQKYDHMVTLQAIQQDGSFVRCCRPECGGGQFHDGGAGFPIVTCQACGTRTCYRHTGLPWHEGLTCNEFEDPDTAIRMLREHVNDLELASTAEETSLPVQGSQGITKNTEFQSRISIALQLISERRAVLASESEKKGASTVAKISKPCPHCHSPVEKRGGCKHITCRCGYEFCYGCLAPWNLAHLATPCSDLHDHADVLRLARMNNHADIPRLARFHGLPNREPAPNLDRLPAQARRFRFPVQPFVVVDGPDGTPPRPQIPEVANRTNWPGRHGMNRPRMGFAVDRLPALAGLPHLMPPISGQNLDSTAPLSRFRPRDPQVRRGDLAQPQVPVPAELDQQDYNPRPRSDPGTDLNSSPRFHLRPRLNPGPRLHPNPRLDLSPALHLRANLDHGPRVNPELLFNLTPRLPPSPAFDPILRAGPDPRGQFTRALDEASLVAGLQRDPRAGLPYLRPRDREQLSAQLHEGLERLESDARMLSLARQRIQEEFRTRVLPSGVPPAVAEGLRMWHQTRQHPSDSRIAHTQPVDPDAVPNRNQNEWTLASNRHGGSNQN